MGTAGIRATVACHEAKLRDANHTGRQTDCGAARGVEAQFKGAGPSLAGPFQF